MTALEKAEFLARCFMLYPDIYDDNGAGEIQAIKQLYMEVVRQRELLSRIDSIVEKFEMFLSDINNVTRGTQ